MTDPDIIDQAARLIHERRCCTSPDRIPGHLNTWRRTAHALADAGLLKCDRECEALRDWDALIRERDAAEAEQDRLADIIKGLYETIDDERATIRKLVRERMKAQAERNMAVGKVDEMRQQLAIVMAEQHATEQDDS